MMLDLVQFKYSGHFKPIAQEERAPPLQKKNKKNNNKQQH